MTTPGGTIEARDMIRVGMVRRQNKVVREIGLLFIPMHPNTSNTNGSIVHVRFRR